MMADATVTSTAEVDPLTLADVALVVPEGIREGEVLVRAEQIGVLPVSVEVASRDEGQLVVSAGRDGSLVFDFPEFTETGTPPRAVLKVMPEAGQADPLAPGQRDFTFGVEFLKDARSIGTTVDNGDNLVQRGLASNVSQYKLELNNGRPGCTLKGSAGEVQVSLDVSVTSSTWYEVTCSRVGESVELRMTEYGLYGRVEEYAAMKEGSIGSLEWPEEQTPVAIGGKLAANGTVIRRATDQFNGQLARPFLTIGN